MLFGVLGAILLSAATPTAAPAPPTTLHPPEIKQLLVDYEQGFRGDRKALERAFASDAFFVTVSDKTEKVSARKIAESIPGWIKSADPKSRVEIIAVGMTNERMATVSLRLYWNGGVYDDHLNLQHLSSGWKIVAKLCVEQKRRAERA